MISRRTLAALLLTLVSASPTLAEDPVLRIGTEGAYPPFNFINEKGELAGFDVDIAKALCKEMQRTCTFVVTPWAEIIEGLEQNKYDLMVSSMAFTEERAKRIAYSDPYYRSHAVFIGDAKKYQDISPEGLAGARITAGKGTMQSQYLSKVYAKSTLVFGEDQPQAQSFLEQGKADLMLGDAIELMSFLESAEGSAFEFIGDPVTNDFLQSTAHVTARKSDTALLEQVNAAIKKTRLDGSYERINDIYFPFSIY
ncbi:transporter substrate-binding domain-containing protein [Rhizobium sp. DKSPLA3]|uniref:Transporter substrate-binding domain-containing protein n=1 Tax=Rhizobium quercicola TaxID=2901226 RepID=A0A9X1NN58_9HYPH|nr:transporter substrate-binding domain-containing protein [Rhizobium quercicola]MCD7107610.1 transporter substrate-binding domain-containing protein [Rhizobium quercicola]